MVLSLIYTCPGPSGRKVQEYKTYKNEYDEAVIGLRISEVGDRENGNRTGGAGRKHHRRVHRRMGGYVNQTIVI